MSIPQISEDDRFIFCGTTSGDIMKINLKTRLLSDCGPVKTKYSLVGRFNRSPGSAQVHVPLLSGTCVIFDSAHQVFSRYMFQLVSNR